MAARSGERSLQGEQPRDWNDRNAAPEEVRRSHWPKSRVDSIRVVADLIAQTGRDLHRS